MLQTDSVSITAYFEINNSANTVLILESAHSFAICLAEFGFFASLWCF